MNSLRKWFYRPRRDDTSLLAQFYFADEGLNLVAGELDSFDGRKDPERCSALVNQLRHCQDKVLNICIEMMDELLPNERAPRDFRVKFPDDVMQENLFGQLWFGAECLAAGNSILNREAESTRMRPLAKAVTKTIENVRNLLREQCLKPNPDNIEHIRESLKIFDHFFAEFELCYVSAMVPVKTIEEHDIQENVVVMFSEALQRALRIGLVSQDQVDNYDPALMFTIPRLAIVCGLIVHPDGPLSLEKDSKNVSELFRPFKALLLKIKELLWTMTTQELGTLEKCLCSMEEPDFNLKNLNDEQPLPTDAYGPVTYTLEFVHKFYSSHPSCPPFSPDLGSLGKKVEKHDRKRERTSGKGSKTRARQERQNDRFLSRLTGIEERPRARRRSRKGGSNPQQRDQHTQSFPSGYYPNSVSSSRSERQRNYHYRRQYNPSFAPMGSRGYYRLPNTETDQVPLYSSRHSQYYPHLSERYNTFLCECNSSNAHYLPDATGGPLPPQEQDFSHPCPYLHASNYRSISDTREKDGCAVPPNLNSCQQSEYSYMDFENRPVEMESNKTANIQECVSNIVTADPSLLSPSIFYDNLPESMLSSRFGTEALSNELNHLNFEEHFTAISLCPSCSEENCSCNKNAVQPPDSTNLYFRDSDANTHKSHPDQTFLCDTNLTALDACNGCNSLTPVPSARSIHTSLRPYGSPHVRDQPVSSPDGILNKVSSGDNLYNVNANCSEARSKLAAEFEGGSSGLTSPHHSGTEDDEEVALALQAAEVAATWKARAKFSDPRDLIHSLFVCISGVADQLQTNHASDLRKILKCVFLLNQTTDEEEDQEKFLEELGKEDISNTESEQLSVESAEDALVVIGTPDNTRVSSPDEVVDLEYEEEEEDELEGNNNLQADNCSIQSDSYPIVASELDNSKISGSPSESHDAAEESNPTYEGTSNGNDSSCCISVGSNVSSNPTTCEDCVSVPNNFLPSTSTIVPVASQNRDHLLSLSNEHHSKIDNKESDSHDSEGGELPPYESEATTPVSFGGELHQDVPRLRNYVQDPPSWVPDAMAPRCMACKAAFTLLRRRHHCRNCGKVFCSHCSRHFVPLPHFGIWRNVRVCNACFLYYVTTTADGSSALS